MESLEVTPLAIKGGAIYPYSEILEKRLFRKGKFDGEYSLGRVIGTGQHRRILVPRNMVPDCDNDLRVGGTAFDFTSSFKAHTKEQERVVSETVKLLEAGHNFMVQAPTGFGKTVCAMEIIARIGRKTLVIVTKEDLKTQWAKEAQAILGLTYGKGLGIIQGNKIATMNCGIVIATVQSITKEDRYAETLFADFGLVIVDECHRIAADFFSQSMFRVPSFMRFGLSATPDRADGKEEVLHAHLGPTLVSTQLATLVPKVIMEESPWSIPLVTRQDKKTKQNKLVELPHSAGKCGHVLKMLAGHHGRNQMIVNFTRQAFEKGRHVVVMSDLREHLDTLGSMLMSQPGIGPQHIGLYVGGMKEKERAINAAKPILLATYQMMKEGTDIPSLDTLVMATPKADVRQIVGRITRIADKLETRVLDIVDATSSVFRGYWKRRLQWYVQQGIEVLNPKIKKS